MRGRGRGTRVTFADGNEDVRPETPSGSGGPEPSARPAGSGCRPQAHPGIGTAGFREDNSARRMGGHDRPCRAGGLAVAGRRRQRPGHVLVLCRGVPWSRHAATRAGWPRPRGRRRCAHPAGDHRAPQRALGGVGRGLVRPRRLPHDREPRRTRGCPVPTGTLAAPRACPDRYSGRPGPPAVEVAGARRVGRSPGRRPAVHSRRGERLPALRHGLGAGCYGRRRAGGAHRGVDRRTPTRSPLPARMRGPQRFHRTVRRRRPLHRRLPHGRGAGAPARRRARVSATHRNARPAQRRPLRRGHRACRRGRTLAGLERANLFVVALDDQ